MVQISNKQSNKTISARFLSLSRRYYLLVGILFLIVVFAAILLPRQATFSYSGTTCFAQPVIAPGMLRSRSESFRLEATNQLRIGGVAIVAGGACVVPTKAPTPGAHQVSLSLFGVSLLAKSYSITVPSQPKVSLVPLNKPIPVSRALTIPLSVADGIFSYKVRFNDKTAGCRTHEKATVCDIQRLNLSQGVSYTLQLERYFAGYKVATLANQTVATLSATSITGSSVQKGQMVYAKPKSVDIQVDKSATTAYATLIRIDGDKREEIAVTTSFKDKTVTVAWPNDLPRQTSYELTLKQVVATDGSSLVDPFVLPFSVSGGPKVTSVSVGKYKVPLGTTATLTFDQPLAEGQDISGVVTASGGAKVTGKKGTQVFVSLADVPKCGDVLLSVSDGLRSNYDVTGGSAWKYNTRIICHTVGSIGASAKGRAISAYYFGSGPTSVVYTGAIHGNETSTRALMLRWIDELEANARSIPADKTVVVVPAINPDGVASGTRTNGNNIDLNRNFGTSDWKKDITTVSNQPFAGGGGSSAMSEPEARAIAGLVSRLRPQLVLSYHSIGGVVAANQAGISSSRARIYASLSGYGNATGSSTTFEYAISGTADDYYAERLGVASVLIELGSYTYHQFEYNRSAMWAMLR